MPFKKGPATLHLGFHLKSKRTTGPAMLYCRLSYNSERTGEYAIGINVPIDAWNRSAKSLPAEHPQAELIRLRVAQVWDQHERILMMMKLQENPATISAESIRNRWLEQYGDRTAPKPKFAQPDPSLTLLSVYKDYLTYLNRCPKEERKAANTIYMYQNAGVHLEKFLTKNNQRAFLAEEVTPGFGMKFHAYLRTKGLQVTFANRCLNMVKIALNYALLYDRIRTNGLFQFKSPKGEGAKPIVFLSEMDISNLTALTLPPIYDTVRKWALFMCYTGLDYHDALKLTKSQAVYRVPTPNGDKWVYQRLKLRRAPQWGECHIPILPQTEALLADLPNWQRVSLALMNMYLKVIAQQLDLPFAFCTKVCRKTAGTVFLREGLAMQTIQKILGHQSLAMTEKHYLNVQSCVVDRDMANLRSAQDIIATPFRQIQSAY